MPFFDRGYVFGCGVGFDGDRDGDGIGDLSVGSRYDDDTGGNKGAVWLLNLNGATTQPPDPNFLGSPTQGMVPLTVDFTDTSSAGTSAWSWDFGDGGSSTDQNPSYTYPTPGTYTVALTATGPGGSATETKQDYVLVDALPPVADFSGTPTSGDGPLPVTFTDLTTGWVSGLSWDFGDGGSSAEQHPTWVYGTPGTFTVSLTATGPGGEDTETKTGYVVVNTPPPPVAEFSAAPTDGDAPLDVAFTNLTTGHVDTWSWDFGDGGSSAAQHSSHLYELPGTYTVTLTATGLGGTDVETKLDHVVANTPDAPEADFTGTPTSGDAPLEVVFANLTTSHVETWSWDFGDGGSSAEEEPVHTYETPGTYTVALTATGLGGSDTETKVDYVVADVPPPPTADFSAAPTSGDAPLDVAFTDLTASHVTSWSWDFGDGGTSTDQHPAYTYANPGTYTVGLTATGLGGTDVETKVDYVVADVPPPPVADFSGAPSTGDAPLKVYFTDLSSGHHDQWSWTFGDGGAATGPNPNHLYENPGTYTVSLSVTGLGGSDTETKIDYVVADVPPPPTAVFSGTPTSGDAPLEVTFTDLSIGHTSSWDWSFGDGGTSTEHHPVYAYPTPGTYTVSMTVTGLGGSDTETKIDYVVADVPPPPVAEFSGTPTSGDAPLEVSFTDLTTSHADTCDWTFGDGGTSAEQNPVYVYANPGTYTVSLSVTGLGGADSTTKVDYVVADLPPPPTADFSGAPTSGPAPLEVTFTDLTTSHADQWSWSFGDGGTSTDQHPQYTYPAPGTYTVSLTATGLGGSDSETKTDYVVVTPPPPDADFDATPRAGDAPLDVVFTDLTTGDVSSWSWDFGDGGASSAQHPSHTYETPGTYTVSLTATGEGGPDTETKVDFIVADTPPPPAAEFTGTPTSGDAPLVVCFTDLTTGQVSAWSWDFGDGGTSTAQSPSHLYETPGTYTVSLTATGLGGPDTMTKQDYVTADVPPPPVAEFSGVPTMGDAPLTVVFTDLTTSHVHTWSWDFGDGGTSAEQSPAYVFALPGTYTVSLTVTGLGGSDTMVKPDYIVAEVPPPPVADFSGTPIYGSAPHRVEFTDLGSGHVSSWDWDFGDGGTSTDQHPEYTYPTPGTFTVSLTVEGLGGTDSLTRTDYVVVEPAGLLDPSFESQTPGSLPAPPWLLVFGGGHVINPDGFATDGTMPTEGANWLEVGAEGTVNATPPTNPGGETLPPIGGAGVTQDFLYGGGQTAIRFDAAFLRDGAADDPVYNDWMSVDVTDGYTTWNLFYADTFTATPNTSAKYGLPMTDVSRVSVDLADLFPDSTSSTVFTLTVQVGNGGDDQLPSRGYVDHFLFGVGAGAVVRNGSGTNPVVYSALNAPTIGEVWDAQIDVSGHPGATLTVIAAYDAPLEGVFTNFGELLIAPPPLGNFLFMSYGIPVGDVASHASPIVDDILLLGVEAYTQSVILGGGSPALTNAIDVVVGL